MSDLFFSWPEIVSITAGQWLLQPAGNGTNAILDDSRSISAGALFVAIVGELADGHNYVRHAAKAGAAAVCCQRPPTADELAEMTSRDCGWLLVPDTLAAFQTLAHAHRRRFSDLLMIGITGSCGKTSTKEICAAVLSQLWPEQVFKAPGSTNNHFGVPRNLLCLHSSLQAAVLELGTNHPGEIAHLTALTGPQCGLITNIGAAHLEAFVDLDGVAREKGALLAGLPSDGTAIIPAGGAGAKYLRQCAGKRQVLTFGTEPDADLRCEYLGQQGNGYGIKLTQRDNNDSMETIWPLGGAHQAQNAAAAVLVGLMAGLDLATAAAGLQLCQLPGARMARAEINGVHWVNDSYNANPDSLRASLAWFAEISHNAQQRVLVLGDMRELGTASENAHQQMLRTARQMFPKEHIITIGEAMAKAAAGMNLICYPDSDAAANLAQSLTPGTWVYLKGSNSLNLSKIMPHKK